MCKKLARIPVTIKAALIGAGGAIIAAIIGISQCSKSNKGGSSPSGQITNNGNNSTVTTVIGNNNTVVLSPSEDTHTAKQDEKELSLIKDANSAYAMALIHHNNRDFERAVEYYSIAIEQDNKYRQAYIDRGFAYTFLKNWKEATRDYWYVVINFSNYESVKRQNVQDNYLHAQEMWRDSLSFAQDIYNNIVYGKTNDGGLRLRNEPILDDDNIIRTMEKGEVVSVLERGKRQKIRGMNAYWYKVRDEYGHTGWCYGWYIDFFPDETAK